MNTRLQDHDWPARAQWVPMGHICMIACVSTTDTISWKSLRSSVCRKPLYRAKTYRQPAAVYKRTQKRAKHNVTKASQELPHPTTGLAQPDLTDEIERDRVHMPAL